MEQVAPLLAAARQELDFLAETEVMLQQMEEGAGAVAGAGAGGNHLEALLEVQVGGQGSRGGCGVTN